MNTKHALSGAPRKDAAITQLYGKIGIPAVAAAARYQGKEKKDATTVKSSKIKRGISPRQ